MEVESLENLCVAVGAYESRAKARRAGRIGEIPKGYNEIKLNKILTAYVWNPTRYTFEFNE